MKLDWYKLAQTQEAFDFYEDVETQEVSPVSPEMKKIPRSIDDLDELLDNHQGYNEVTMVLNRNGFDWQEYRFNQEHLITVNLDGKLYVIEDFGYPETKDASEWINDMFEHELYSYVIPKEDDDFWENVHGGSRVYHATTRDHVEDIQRDGLALKSETRGISNRGTGAAVFTSENPDDLENYGNIIFEVNLWKMKQNGYTPSASRETPIEENETRKSLAHQIGLYNYEPNSDFGWEGLYETTVVFHEPIPAQYLEFYSE